MKSFLKRLVLLERDMADKKVNIRKDDNEVMVERPAAGRKKDAETKVSKKKRKPTQETEIKKNEYVKEGALNRLREK